MGAVVLGELPSAGVAFWRAMLSKPARTPSVAGQRVIVPGHLPDVDALARYARVCGFTLRDALPPTWLHVLTFPLHLQLLADPGSTLPLAGLVHVRNAMRLHRPVQVTEQLELSCEIGNLRPHRRGALVDLTGQVRVGDELVWEGVSSYLARGVEVEGATLRHAQGPSGPGASGHRTPSPGTALPQARWRLPADLGRQYREVSGDPNPIHTSALAARLFGFPRPIAHGMWTHARVLAALENRLPASYAVEVSFTKPIPLPGTVGFAATQRADGWDVAVTDRDGGKPHLLARIEG